jgi:hypothetical protein
MSHRSGAAASRFNNFFMTSLGRFSEETQKRRSNERKIQFDNKNNNKNNNNINYNNNNNNAMILIPKQREEKYNSNQISDIKLYSLFSEIRNKIVADYRCEYNREHKNNKTPNIGFIASSVEFKYPIPMNPVLTQQMGRGHRYNSSNIGVPHSLQIPSDINPFFELFERAINTSFPPSSAFFYEPNMIANLQPVHRPLNKDAFENLLTQKYEDYQKENKLQSAEKCTICYMDFEANDIIKKLQCKHIYHKSCIADWFEKNHTCPICREVAGTYSAKIEDNDKNKNEEQVDNEEVLSPIPPAEIEDGEYFSEKEEEVKNEQKVNNNEYVDENEQTILEELEEKYSGTENID